MAASAGAETTHRRAFRSGVFLSLTNPQNIAYWAAIGGALRAIGVTEPTVEDNLAFFAAFMVSSTIWAFFLSAFVDRGVSSCGARMGADDLSYVRDRIPCASAGNVASTVGRGVTQ